MARTAVFMVTRGLEASRQIMARPSIPPSENNIRLVRAIRMIRNIQEKAAWVSTAQNPRKRALDAGTTLKNVLLNGFSLQ
jgi:hypothetical protein